MATPNAAAISKFIDIPVSYHTGVPNIGIPIGTISEGSLSLPISINYNSSGIRVDELASSIGLGWALNSGGVISRSVVGAPDESGSGFYTNPGYPTGLKDGDACSDDPNCTKTPLVGSQQLCINCQTLSSKVQDKILDTEPDIFSFSFGGTSGKFIFDATGAIKMLQANDLKVDYSSWWDKWIFTTPQGIKYYFGNFFERTAYEKALASPTGAMVSSSWYLVRIESADGQHYIDLDYATEAFTYIKMGEQTFTSFPNNATPYVESTPFNSLYTTTVQSVRLKSVRTSSGIESVDIDSSSAIRTDVVTTTAKSLKSIKVSNGLFCKTFNLQQSYFTSTASPYYSTTDGTANTTRLRLDGLQEVSCDGSQTIPAYTFNYNSTALPARSSNGKDLWGYYNGKDANTGLLPRNITNLLNGKFPGSFSTAALSPTTYGDRTPDENSMKAGILEKVTYPTGGYTQFVYEAHRLTPNDTKLIGGLRVKSEIVYNTDGTQAKREDYVYNQGERFDEPAQTDVNNPSSSELYYSLDVMGSVDPLRKQEVGLSIYNNWLPKYTFIYSSSPLKRPLQGYHIGYDSVTVNHVDGSSSAYSHLFSNYISLQTFYFPYPTTVGVQDNVLPTTETHRNSSGVAVQVKCNTFQNDYLGQVFGKKVYVANNGQGPIYFYSKYSLNSYRLLLKQKTEINDGVTTVVNYDYNQTFAHLNPISVRVMGSNGDEKKTVSKYLADIDATNPNYANTASFTALNMIGVPLETREYYKGNLLKGGVVEFTKMTVPTTPTNVGYALFPYKYYRMGRDGALDLRVTVNSMDVDGKPFQVTKTGFAASTYFYWTPTNLLFRKTDKYGSSADSLSELYSYTNTSSLVASTFDVNGLTKKYTYDALMRLSRLDDRMDASGNDIQATINYTYKYHDANSILNYTQSTTTWVGAVSPVTSISYSDGLGRGLNETIQTNAQTVIDGYTTYDALGRLDKQYDPIQTSTPASSDLYTSTQYETSPLSRPIKRIAQDLTSVQYAYSTNTAADNVLRLDATLNPDAATDLSYNVVTAINSYDVNTLYVTTVTNENGKTTQIFKDKLQKTILTRKKLNGQNVDTYYAYDIFDNLFLVIPPGAIDLTNLSNPSIAISYALCYRYNYDKLDRVTAKIVPASSPQIFYYDTRDYQVLSQDGNMRTADQAQYLKTEYDSYGRIVKTGWINTTTPYTASSIPAIADANKLTETQYYIGSNYVQNEGKRVLKPTGVSTVRDFIWSYTARISPYAYRGNPGWMGEQHLMSTTYRNGVDAKDTPIQDADHEGVDWVTAGFDGLQQPTAAYRYLFSANSLQEVRTANVFTYDDLHRLTALNYGYGTGGSGVGNQASLSNMVYNYKSQLVQKNIGYANGKYLQGIDYGYNSCGWLTSINGGNIAVYNSPIATQSTILKGTVNNLAIAPYLTNLANNYAEQTKLKMAAPTAPPPTAHQNTDLFTERIYYNDADGRFGAAQQNNGNIQAVAWQVGGKDAQGYGFTYDDLDRLINSNYYDIQNTTPGNIIGNTTFSTDNKYQETVVYDIRGNITNLQRNGLIGGTWTATGFTAATYGQIDNMTYTYNNQNQITKIIDGANLGKGFQSVNNANTTQYTYDANGNITSDLNKGITNIAYNYLNLPQVITFTGNRSLTFVYNADGEKLEKIINNNGVITTTDYVNGVEYKNTNINRIAHSEGAVVLNENNALQHEYVLRDHLGNVRVTFRDGINLGNAYVDWNTWTYVDPNANNPSFNDGTVTASDIKQINNYTPFGLNMEGNWNGAAGNNKCQYNEHELNDDFGLDWLDYGFRYYDAAVGRFWARDPLAEWYIHQTPYAYAGNSPVSDIDFMGLGSEQPKHEEDGSIWLEEVEITASSTYYGPKGLSPSDLNSVAQLQTGDWKPFTKNDLKNYANGTGQTGVTCNPCSENELGKLFEDIYSGFMWGMYGPAMKKINFRRGTKYQDLSDRNTIPDYLGDADVYDLQNKKYERMIGGISYEIKQKGGGVYKSTDDYQIPGHIENLAIKNLLYIQRGFSPHFILVTLGDINYSKTIGIYAKYFRVAYTQEAAMFRINDKGLYEFFFKISGQNYTNKGFK